MEPAGKASELAGRALKPAGRASEPGGRGKKEKNGAFLLFGGSGPLPNKDEPPVQCTNGAIMTTTNEGERAPNKLVRELQTV